LKRHLELRVVKIVSVSGAFRWRSSLDQLLERRLELRKRYLPLAAFALLLSSAGPALAATPVNDDVANATVLSSFPYVSTVDMTQATAGGTDPWCDAATGTVWFKYVAVAEETLTVSVPANEPDTRVCVLPDSVTAGTYYFVQPTEVRSIILDQGRTYFIELAVVNSAAAATIDLQRGPALFDLIASLDPTGLVDRVSGGAILSGTITCSEPGTANLFIRLTQPAGAKRVADDTEQVHIASCGPSATRWQITMHSLVAYVPGSASLRMDAYGGGVSGYNDYDLFTTTMRLKAKS
jgi:hypothetical protein